MAGFQLTLYGRIWVTPKALVSVYIGFFFITSPFHSLTKGTSHGALHCRRL
jgi:hypothetical protein